MANLEDKRAVRMPVVLNKAPNPIQITWEQLMINAQIHKEKEVVPTKQGPIDEEELENYKFEKRKEFEGRINKQRMKISNFIRYAEWEANLQEFERSRSIFERAIDVNHKHITLWMKYAEMEMKNKFVNNARNVWERATALMPRIDHYWYKYTYMEEVLGNYNRTRSVFEKWMSWYPEDKAWLAYIKFERRMGEFEKCREIMYRYLEAFPKLHTYLKVIKFEIHNKNIQDARNLFEKTMNDLGIEAIKEEYFVLFAKFEIQNKEYSRAKEIFKYGLNNLPKDQCQALQNLYIEFEKSHGEKDEIDIIILNKRRIVYEDKIKENPTRYDIWFDLINLEQEYFKLTQEKDKIIQVFENAVKQIPPKEEKMYWRRYIYFWYFYTMFIEIELQNINEAISIYQRAIAIIPHQKFTFSRIWIFIANCYMRSQNLDQARKSYGVAIGKCPTQKIFDNYIQLEMQLANFDRVRIIFEKYIECFPQLPNPYIKYAEFEKSLDESDRYEFIFNMALNQPFISQPEVIWKAYIDNEIQGQNYDKVRTIYKSLLERSKHIKIWISYSQFECDLIEKINNDIKQEENSNENFDTYIQNIRKIFNDAEKYFKDNPDLKEERILLYEYWKTFESKYGSSESAEQIIKKMPKRVKKQRKILAVDGNPDEQAGIEEYYDYIFPDDEQSIKNLKILQKALNWKKVHNS